MRGWPLVLVLLILVGKGKAAGQEKPVSQVLHDLFTAEWDYDMQQSPEWASTLGDRRWNDRWPDDSLEAFARRPQYWSFE